MWACLASSLLVSGCANEVPAAICTRDGYWADGPGEVMWWSESFDNVFGFVVRDGQILTFGSLSNGTPYPSPTHEWLSLSGDWERRTVTPMPDETFGEWAAAALLPNGDAVLIGSFYPLFSPERREVHAFRRRDGRDDRTLWTLDPEALDGEQPRDVRALGPNHVMLTGESKAWIVRAGSGRVVREVEFDGGISPLDDHLPGASSDTALVRVGRVENGEYVRLELVRVGAGGETETVFSMDPERVSAMATGEQGVDVAQWLESGDLWLRRFDLQGVEIWSMTEPHVYPGSVRLATAPDGALLRCTTSIDDNGIDFELEMRDAPGDVLWRRSVLGCHEIAVDACGDVLVSSPSGLARYWRP